MKTKKTSDTFTFHKYADLFPCRVPYMPQAHRPMNTEGNDEWLAFVQDVRINGQREPVALFNGQLLDGRHRYLATRALGVEVEYVDFKGTDAEALALVQSLNLHRRHMTKPERAVFYRKLRGIMEADQQHGGDRTEQDDKNVGLPQPSETARQKAARKAGISEGQASQIDTLTDEEFAEVADGTKTVGGVVKEKKEAAAAATAKRAAKGHTPSQQDVVNPLLDAAHAALEKAEAKLEEAITECDRYEWSDLDYSRKEKLARVASDLSDTLNRLPWGSEEA